MVCTFVGDEDEVLLASDRNIQIDAQTGWTPGAVGPRPHRGTAAPAASSASSTRTPPSTRTYVMSDLAEAARIVRRHLPEWSGKLRRLRHLRRRPRSTG